MADSMKRNVALCNQNKGIQTQAYKPRSCGYTLRIWEARSPSIVAIEKKSNSKIVLFYSQNLKGSF